MTWEPAWSDAPVSRRRPRWGCWFVALTAAGAFVFTVGLAVRLRCVVGRCPGPVVQRLFDLDALGALPRLFTTVVLLLVAVSAGAGSRRMVDRARLWWSAIACGGTALAVAKAVSLHSTVERDEGGVSTLVGAVLLTTVGLPLVWATGRRWSVRGAGPVAGALAAYALAAVGLDQVTALVASISSSSALHAVAVYLEEGGEAGTALIALAAVLHALHPGEWGPGGMDPERPRPWTQAQRSQ